MRDLGLIVILAKVLVVVVKIGGIPGCHDRRKLWTYKRRVCERGCGME